MGKSIKSQRKLTTKKISIRNIEDEGNTKEDSTLAQMQIDEEDDDDESFQGDDESDN